MQIHQMNDFLVPAVIGFMPERNVFIFAVNRDEVEQQSQEAEFYDWRDRLIIHGANPTIIALLDAVARKFFLMHNLPKHAAAIDDESTVESDEPYRNIPEC